MLGPRAQSCRGSGLGPSGGIQRVSIGCVRIRAFFRAFWYKFRR